MILQIRAPRWAQVRPGRLLAPQAQPWVLDSLQAAAWLCGKGLG